MEALSVELNLTEEVDNVIVINRTIGKIHDYVVAVLHHKLTDDLLKLYFTEKETLILLFRKQMEDSITVVQKVFDYCIIGYLFKGIFTVYDLVLLFHYSIVEKRNVYGMVKLNEGRELVTVVYLKMDVLTHWYRKADKKKDSGR